MKFLFAFASMLMASVLLPSVLLAGAPQTITFRTIPNQTFGQPPFLVSAQATSGLPVTFTISTPAVCKISQGLVTLAATGICTIAAAQPGNAAFEGAATVRQSFIVKRAGASGALSPAPGSPFTVGPNAFAVAVADFNLDGIPDIAVLNGSANNVTLLLGNGTGGFTTAPGSPFAAGVGPQSPVIADFNGDGFPDLAVANSTSSGLTILLGNGQGGFPTTIPVPLAAGTSPVSLAVGDFNGDGFADLAVADRVGSSLISLLGNGKGGFTAAPGSPFTLGISYIGPVSIVVGDFNEDGIQDVAVVNQLSNNIAVLPGNGNGAFGQSTTGFLRTGAQPLSIVAGDFNLDGHLDLATADNAGNSVTVYLGNGLGDFSAAPASPFTASSPWSLAVGDLNGDGNPDLIAGTAGAGVMALLGDGNGGFGAATASPSAAIPISIAIGDFNGDGLADLATANYGVNSVTVLLGGVATTTLVLTTPAATVPVNQAIPLTATLSVQGVAFNPPGGVVTFIDGTTLLGASNQSSSPYTFTASGLQGGTHVLTAVYSGDSRSLASTSAPITIFAGGPTPTLSSLSPATWMPGGAPFTLTVNGAGFAQGAQVLWNGTALSTKFVSATQLAASANAAVLSSSGSALISVADPWADSNSLQYAVLLPAITTLSPATWLVGGPDFTLTVNGSNFTAGSLVQWNGNVLTTKFVSATQLTVAVASGTIASAGAASLTVQNAPGALSNAVVYPDSLPAVTTVNPATYLVGGAGYTLTVNGTGFVPGSQVEWNGSGLVTKFVSATQVTAAVSAANIASGGTVNVAVSNGVGAASGSVTVTGILPTITTLSPVAGWLVGGADFTLTVNGTGFVANSQVIWNSILLVTKPISATQLTATVPAGTTSLPGAASITVSNAPGAVSNAVAYPDILPTITTLAPATWLIDGPAFTLTVNGTGFVPNSQVEWNGSPLFTKFVSATQVTASVAATQISAPAPVSIAVLNAVGAVSNAITYAAAGPTLSALNPTTAVATGNDFKLCTTGTNFDAASQVQWNGTALTTTFVSATSLCATVTAALIAVSGTGVVTVVNPDGTLSGKIGFVVTNPVPAVPQGGVVPIYSNIAVIQPGSWVSVYGAGLANGDYIWNGGFPTTLGGTSVTVNGKSAYLWSVSPGQINMQAPDDTATGLVKVVISGPFGPITTTVTLAATAPSFSLWPGTHYASAAILTPDGSGAYGNGGYDLMGPAQTDGLNTRPVKAGETMLLYGVGFGPTKPVVPAGAVFSGSAPSATPATVTIGGIKAQVLFCGITSAGLYQLNIVVPAVPSGDQALIAKVGTSQAQTGVLVNVK